MTFRGTISDVRIYNRVLSPQEIVQSYFSYCLLYMRWYERLWFWVKMTWWVLLGRQSLRGCWFYRSRDLNELQEKLWDIFS